ncbi:MAG: glycoside hydrolase family 16 protein [Acutalibacteraceae bacterium]|nr:glycoside hydrolase family 16 protein [Acutalibacteraceae bacterium]
MINYSKIKEEALAKGIPYEKMGRQLVWYDEFESDSLDMDKWCFTRTMHGADCEYDNSEKCIRVEDNQVHMQVHRSELEDKDYVLSEGLTTMETMNFKYGYVEMRAKLPFRHGAWPSFWMKSNTPFKKAHYMAEIDIFEVFSSDRNVVSNLHKWVTSTIHVMLPGGEGSLKRAYTFENYENLNDEYHTYGFEWDEKYMSFYVDDEMYTRFPIDESGEFGEETIKGMEGFHDFAYIIFNNEIFTQGRSWRPEEYVLKEDDEMPIDYYIDYVRFYQNPEKEEIKLGDEIAAKKAEIK